MIINRVYGDMLQNARRYDEAIAQYRKTIEMDPNFPTTHNGLGRAYEVKGMYDQAVAEYLAFSGPNVSPAERLARQEAFTRSGWKAFLQIGVSNLLERSRKGYVRPFTIASSYARLGQKDEAFVWLEKAYQDRDYQMTELDVRPELDSLRSDPRLAEFVRRVGLPQ
jgi:tetratricopeptide (TPR) repeat protein